MNLVRVQVQGPKTRWHHIVAESRGAEWKQMFEAKWPDLTVTIEPYRCEMSCVSQSELEEPDAPGMSHKNQLRQKRRSKANSDRPKGGADKPGARSADLRGSPVAGPSLTDKPAKRRGQAGIFARPVGAKGWQQLCLPFVADERKRKKK